MWGKGSEEKEKGVKTEKYLCISVCVPRKTPEVSILLSRNYTNRQPGVILEKCGLILGQRTIKSNEIMPVYTKIEIMCYFGVFKQIFG